MSRPSVARCALGAVGIAAIAFGLWSMREFDFSQLSSVVIWLGVGTVLHDGVLAPIVVGLCVVAARILPKSAHKAAAVALVVWGTLTVMALPVLSGKGGKPGIETLLNHDYRLNWLLGTIGVLMIVIVAAGVSHLSNRRSG